MRRLQVLSWPDVPIATSDLLAVITARVIDSTCECAVVRFGIRSGLSQPRGEGMHVREVRDTGTRNRASRLRLPVGTAFGGALRILGFCPVRCLLGAGPTES